MVAIVLLLLVLAAFMASAADARVNRWKVVEPHNAKLDRIAMCESRMNWRIVSANGLYRGGLQFSLSTWRSVGGRGLPERNSRIEQKYRGVLLFLRIGRWDSTAGWPVCGRR